MSDSLFNHTLDTAKNTYRGTKNGERQWWNSASNESRRYALEGRLDYTEISNVGIATEHTYQEDFKAKYNLMVSQPYDSLPVTVRDRLTESLIEQGVLPNPKKYQGIGQEFALENGDVLIECDRCEESFVDKEDFKDHKLSDHGDDDSEYAESEEYYVSMLQPDIPMETIREARRKLAETDEGDLHRNYIFNGDQLPSPTVSDPPMPKGKKGYNPNPNAGLYDNKIFKHGTSQQRDEGLESYNKDDYVDMSKWENAKLQAQKGDKQPFIDLVKSLGGDWIWAKDFATIPEVIQQIDLELENYRDGTYESYIQDFAEETVRDIYKEIPKTQERKTCQCGENFTSDDYYVHLNETGHWE